MEKQTPRGWALIRSIVLKLQRLCLTSATSEQLRAPPQGHETCATAWLNKDTSPSVSHSRFHTDSEAVTVCLYVG